MDYIQASRIEVTRKPRSLVEKLNTLLFNEPPRDIFIPIAGDELAIAVGSATVNIINEGADVEEYIYPLHTVLDVRFVEAEENDDAE